MDDKTLLPPHATFEERAKFRHQVIITGVHKFADLPPEVKGLFPEDIIERIPKDLPSMDYEPFPCDGTPMVLTFTDSIFEPGIDAPAGTDCGDLMKGGAQGYGESTFRICSVRQTPDGKKLHFGWQENLYWGKYERGNAVQMRLPERAVKERMDQDALSAFKM